MNIRTIATLAVAIVFGLVAVVILNGYLGSSRKPEQQVAAAEGTPVVVAAGTIARGAVLQSGVLKVVNYPQGSVPAGAFASVDQVVSTKNGQRFALQDMSLNEPILASQVSGPGGKFTLSSAIAPGMQAVAVRSSDVAGVGGFLLPGDRVDVLLTRAVSSGNDQNSVTQIVAENVQVMGVDQSDDTSSDKPVVARAITLEVTPAQAQVIALGQVVGTVSLALRHVADAEALAQRATTVAQLGFASPAARTAPVKPAPRSVVASAAGDVPLYGPGVVRVTRATETTGYRLGGR